MADSDWLAAVCTAVLTPGRKSLGPACGLPGTTCQDLSSVQGGPTDWVGAQECASQVHCQAPQHCTM
jgi:hypothetical protein